MRFYRLLRFSYAASLGVAFAAVGAVMAYPGVPAVAQTPTPPAQTVTALPVPPAQNDEMARLRPFLGAKVDEKVQPAVVSKVSAKFPVKVFLSTGLDTKVRDNLAQWASRWQKKDAKKYGALELVEKAGEADIILVRYTLPDRAVQQTKSVPIPVTTTTYDNRTWPSGYGSYGGSGTYTLGRRSVSVTVVPTYTYIIARSANGFEILTRDETLSPVGDDKGDDKKAGQVLWNKFKNLLKNKSGKKEEDKPKR